MLGMTGGRNGGAQGEAVGNLLGTPVSHAYAVKAGPWIRRGVREPQDPPEGVASAPTSGFVPIVVRNEFMCVA